MINSIEKFGRIKYIALITTISITSSIILTFISMELFNGGMNQAVFATSIIVPAIIAPSVTWYIIGLLIRIHRLEEESRLLATYDMLTGVLSRHAFLTNIESVFKRTVRNGSLLSLAYIDIDDFKEINDRYGHAAGDEVLKSFGLTVQNNLRGSDFVGRIGGEEFAIALPDTNLNNAIPILDKIKLLTKDKGIKINDQIIFFTISIGVTQYEQNNQVSFEQLAKQSDDALYMAKNSGKDCIIEYMAN